jgi:hypothetical protein
MTKSVQFSHPHKIVRFCDYQMNDLELGQGLQPVTREQMAVRTVATSTKKTTNTTPTNSFQNRVTICHKYDWKMGNGRTGTNKKTQLHTKFITTKSIMDYCGRYSGQTDERVWKRHLKNERKKY